MQPMVQLQGPGLQGKVVQLGPFKEDMPIPYLSRPKQGSAAPHHKLGWTPAMDAEYTEDSKGKKAKSRRKDKIRILKQSGGPADQRYEPHLLAVAHNEDLRPGVLVIEVVPYNLLFHLVHADKPRVPVHEYVARILVVASEPLDPVEHL